MFFNSADPRRKHDKVYLQTLKDWSNGDGRIDNVYIDRSYLIINNIYGIL